MQPYAYSVGIGDTFAECESSRDIKPDDLPVSNADSQCFTDTKLDAKQFPDSNSLADPDSYAVAERLPYRLELSHRLELPDALCESNPEPKRHSFCVSDYKPLFDRHLLADPYLFASTDGFSIRLAFTDAQWH